MTRPLASLLAVVALALPARSQDPALALPALDAGEGLTARVDAATGALRLEELDVRHGGLTLLRTRTAGDATSGLFGRGWRSSLDARQPAGTVVVRRAGKIVLFEDREDGASLELSLDSQGRVTRALGYQVDLRYAYDAQGELVRVRDAATARSRDYGFERGRVASVEGAAGLLLRATHDDDGKVVALETPGGARTIAYWPGGASVEAGAQRWTCEAGRVDHAWGLTVDQHAVTRADGPDAIVTDTPWGRFGLRRDAAGRAVEVHGPFGRIALDPARRTRPTVDPDPSDETWIRDARGRLVAAGALRLRHDERGRVIEVQGPDAFGPRVTTYAWDGADRLVHVEIAAFGRALETVEYAWTDDGRLAGRADADGVAHVVETGFVRATLGPGDRLRLDVLDPDARDAAPLCSFEGGAWTLAPSSAGEPVDRATGLVFRGGRPYSPVLARFLAPDPTARGARAYTGPGLIGALRPR